MPTITLKNVSAVRLGNKRPGETFQVETDADGVVLEPYWRRRLDEERHSAERGHPASLQIIAPTPPPAAPSPAPAPPPDVVASEPAPTKTKKA